MSQFLDDFAALYAKTTESPTDDGFRKWRRSMTFSWFRSVGYIPTLLFYRSLTPQEEQKLLTWVDERIQEDAQCSSPSE